MLVKLKENNQLEYFPGWIKIDDVIYTNVEAEQVALQYGWKYFEQDKYPEYNQYSQHVEIYYVEGETVIKQKYKIIINTEIYIYGLTIDKSTYELVPLVDIIDNNYPYYTKIKLDDINDNYFLDYLSYNRHSEKSILYDSIKVVDDYVYLYASEIPTKDVIIDELIILSNK